MRERERQRERKRDRQTGRETERERERDRERDTEREREREREKGLMGTGQLYTHSCLSHHCMRQPNNQSGAGSASPTSQEKKEA